MSSLLNHIIELAPLSAWAGMWIMGGITIARGAFRLRPNEQVLTGFAIGLIFENWLANLLGQFIPVPLAFWLSAALTLLAGLGFTIKDGWRSWLKIPFCPWQCISLVLLAYSFFAISRGLAIFDDYAHIPTTSLIAAGNIPPSFPLNPAVPYSYHYFGLLFSAQLMRVGQVFPWTALDITRGLTFALTLLLAALWVQRITFSKLAGFCGAVFAAFSMGSRWLLLLLPMSLLKTFSQNIPLIGSGQQSAPNLLAALSGPWVIEGGGPFLYPFAFISGIAQPAIMAFGPNGTLGSTILYMLLLTFKSWRSWKGMMITVVLLSSASLVNELDLPLTLASWGVITLMWMVSHHTLRLPHSLRQWWLVLILFILFTLVQGGTWTDLFRGSIQSAAGAAVQASWQTIGFILTWPPTLVSSHLGVLSLTHPVQVAAALTEIGPIFLVLPLLFIWGLKSFRARRWYEAALILSAFLSILLLFVQYTGSAGVRNTSRLYIFLTIASLWAVPLFWRWARNRSSTIQTFLCVLGSLAVFGGMMLLGIELLAAQKPVLAPFISQLDARFEQKYWNRLEPNALIFDPTPYRAPTVFARYTDSSETWLIAKPGWEKLLEGPDPYALQEAGFDYMYYDYVYWYDVKPRYKLMLQSDPCVKLVEEIKDKRSPDFRRLINLQDCKP
jgi:hypothetical protein